MGRGGTSDDSNTGVVVRSLPLDSETRTSLLGAVDSGVQSFGGLASIAARDIGLALLILQWARDSGDSECPGIVNAFRQVSPGTLIGKIDEIPPPEDELPDAVQAGYELVRSKCGVTAIVAALVAREIAPSEAGRAFTFGLLRFLGDAVTSVNQPESFLGATARAGSRGELVAILKDENGHDLEGAGVSYLRDQCGLPALAKELESVVRSPSGNCALAVQLAAEMLDHFDRGAWGEATTPEAFGKPGTQVTALLDAARFGELHTAVSNFLLWGTIPDGFEQFLTTAAEPVPHQSDSTVTDPEAVASDHMPIVVVSPDGMDVQAIEPPERQLQSISSIGPLVFAAQEIAKGAQSVEQLISELMNFLVVEAPFERTALLEVCSEEKRAIPILVRGKVENTESHVIETKDPNSPLFRQSLSVRSFDRGESNCSPFGSKAFALAPVDFSGVSPVALYADAGQDTIISLDGRRLFRAVVDLLNGKIRALPGALPRDSEK